jgi:hypothetical protein
MYLFTSVQSSRLSKSRGIVFLWRYQGLSHWMRSGYRKVQLMITLQLQWLFNLVWLFGICGVGSGTISAGGLATLDCTSTPLGSVNTSVIFPNSHTLRSNIFVQEISITDIRIE